MNTSIAVQSVLSQQTPTPVVLYYVPTGNGDEPSFTSAADALAEMDRLDAEGVDPHLLPTMRAVVLAPVPLIPGDVLAEMHEVLSQWMNELSPAYDESDDEEVGALLENALDGLRLPALYQHPVRVPTTLTADGWALDDPGWRHPNLRD